MQGDPAFDVLFSFFGLGELYLHVWYSFFFRNMQRLIIVCELDFEVSALAEILVLCPRVGPHLSSYSYSAFLYAGDWRRSKYRQTGWTVEQLNMLGRGRAFSGSRTTPYSLEVQTPLKWFPVSETAVKHQPLVVQRLDKAIHWINRYSVDKC